MILEDIEKQLDDLSVLPADWDGENSADPPSPEVIAVARQLVGMLWDMPKCSVTVQSVDPDAMGGVAVYTMDAYATIWNKHQGHKIHVITKKPVTVTAYKSVTTAAWAMYHAAVQPKPTDWIKENLLARAATLVSDWEAYQQRNGLELSPIGAELPQEANPAHLVELVSLRERCKAQRREIAALHAERDAAWGADRVTVQGWRRGNCYGVIGQQEQFVLRGRRVMGVLVTLGRFGPVRWLASFGAGIAPSMPDAIAKLIENDRDPT